MSLIITWEELLTLYGSTESLDKEYYRKHKHVNICDIQHRPIMSPHFTNYNQVVSSFKILFDLKTDTFIDSHKPKFYEDKQTYF
jgi:hypothetical protein